MARLPERRPHLPLRNTAKAEPYTYPREVRGAGKIKTPRRDRVGHGRALLAELEVAAVQAGELRGRRLAAGLVGDGGMYLTFESAPGFDLALQSLDRSRAGIELVAVSQRADVTFATVFLPEGSLAELHKLVHEYGTKTTKSGKPKNQDLIEGASHIRHAAFEAFWTDDLAVLPQPGQAAWWEVWLRGGEDAAQRLERFRALAGQVGMRLGSGVLPFLDRLVVLALGTREQLTTSVELLDCVAELRRAKDTASFFTDMRPSEQAAWVTSYCDTLASPGPDAPAVCVLDTGVTRSHALLNDFLAENDALTCDANWGVHDHHRHGTAMAGLAVHGDLVIAMAQTAPPAPETLLESVKILAPPGREPDAGVADLHERKALYGALTLEAASRIEVHQPDRQRVFCMAVTTDDGRDRGAPSSWSAEVDSLSLGVDGGPSRLFVLSAGNVEPENWRQYPHGNDTDQIHDPGQAWNALTVGAMTDKACFDPSEFAGMRPIANPGTLSPSSTTSLTWNSSWPNKPDVVLEGGNAAVDERGSADALDELSLLTTWYRPTEKLLVTTGDTSAATALAAKLAGTLLARYPDCWPETVRALVVHSAEWTDAMSREAAVRSPTRKEDYLLRRYGYGVPNLDRASWSAANVLTLVAQDQVQPFGVRESGLVGTKNMNLHTLPWPQQQLEQLFDTQVELRVTLSYYIEPNPARRGWKYRHRYASHGLRFALRNAGESLAEFQARVSRDAQQEDAGTPNFGEPGWRLGARRNRGSVHSDIWQGTAQDLADRNHIAVFPVGGWWKERHQLGRWMQSTRYALIVTIRTPETEVDIYTPVAAAIGVPVPA